MAIIKIRWVLVYMLLGNSPDVFGPYANINRKVINKLIYQFMNDIYGTMVASIL